MAVVFQILIRSLLAHPTRNPSSFTVHSAFSVVFTKQSVSDPESSPLSAGFSS